MTSRFFTTLYGRQGEAVFADRLTRDGWHILARNFRRRTGEIDIIAERNDIVAFIEVKTWRHLDCADLSDVINAIKIHRIIETSKIFLKINRQYNRKRIRYDVVLLAPDGTTQHYEGAFDETR